MTILDFYKNDIQHGPSQENDFNLFRYNDDLFIGFDKNTNLCVIVCSSGLSTSALRQKTKLLSIECNTKISFLEKDSPVTTIAHVIRCFSHEEKEKELFLELVGSMIHGRTSDEEILEIFRILSSFFANDKEPSTSELIGLYAEVDSILFMYGKVDFAKYWQSRDRMKFDFSFSPKMKLEVKATTKDQRIHHFRHEQLMTDKYEIFILSYMLRADDEGLSLFELLNNVKPLLVNNPQKLVRVNTVLKNVSTDVLEEFKYSPDYTESHRCFYYAKDLPRFNEDTPEGVANAEYDCNFGNITTVSEQAFIEMVKKEIGG